MKKNYGWINKQNPLTAKGAKNLRRDRKVLFFIVLSWRSLR